MVPVPLACALHQKWKAIEEELNIIHKYITVSKNELDKIVL